MRNIKLKDVTLREQETSLSFKEIIEIAKTLDKLGVDVVGLAPIANEKIDSLLVRTIASAVKNSALSIPVGMTEEAVDLAWASVSSAAKPRLCVSLPLSAVQMEFKCKEKPAKIKELAGSLVRRALKYSTCVEFEAQDATRSETDFLAEVLSTAVEAGASSVTLCDSAGKMMPGEFCAFIEDIYKRVPSLKNVELGVRCSDELSMASACALSAVMAGACSVDVTINGGTAPSIKSVSRVLTDRGDDLDCFCRVKTTELTRAVRQINWLVRSKKDKNTPFDTGVKNNFAKDIRLDANDSKETVAGAVTKLGYDLSDDDMLKVFETFCSVAEKKSVGVKELEAIIASVALQVPPTYSLVSFVINSGNIINATANIHFTRDGKDLYGLAVGDGPIDAAFMAIENITGCHYELDDFQIQSVTEGREAMGSALIKLRSGGKLYSGNGISTDIIGSSISAYLNALNKIVYEENHS